MADNQIDNYINSLKDTHSPITLDKYKRKLYNLKKELDINSTEEELWEFVEKCNVKIGTKRLTQFILKGYRRFYELPTSYFDEKLKKDNTGSYLNSDNPIASVKEVKKLPDDYRELINKIENPNHKLLLRLVTDYDEILRTDLGDVKISDIVDGIIVIKETKKTKMAVNIKLKPEDLQLVDYSKEYLIDINTVDKANGYSKLVRRLTKLYFGIELNQNSFRHRKATEKFKANEHLPIKQQMAMLKQDAHNRAHSSQVSLENYVDYTDDVNVSLNHKKSINLLMDGKVIHSYKLEDVVKAMELYRIIKEI